MLSFKINELLLQKGKTKYWLAKQCGMSAHAIGKLCKNETTRIEVATIEKICKVLECTPNDIFTSDDLNFNLKNRQSDTE